MQVVNLFLFLTNIVKYDIKIAENNVGIPYNLTLSSNHHSLIICNINELKFGTKVALFFRKVFHLTIVYMPKHINLGGGHKMKKRILLIVISACFGLMATNALAATFYDSTGTYYTEGVDFTLFVEGVGPDIYSPYAGEVLAPVMLVGWGLDDHYYLDSSNNETCIGKIALIYRGGAEPDDPATYFSAKVNLAYAHGAVGAIIMDNVDEPLINPGLAAQTYIPAIFITYDVGVPLTDKFWEGGLIAYIDTRSPVSTPEPATMLLLGLGLLGLVGVRRKIQK